MAEKISTLILIVDLDCHQCYKKIRKILCRLQDQEKIRMISFDDKSKTIIISGPFDPQKLSCKIRCKGGKVIKDIQIKEDKLFDVKPPKPPAAKEKPAFVEPVRDIPAEPAEKPTPVVREKPKEKPVEKPCQRAIEVEIPSWPARPRAPCSCTPGSCSCTPCYQGYYEGCRCRSCGRVYGWVSGPRLSGYYGGHPSYCTCGGYRSCQFFSEEDPSTACSIM